jgi:hypothetical protein
VLLFRDAAGGGGDRRVGGFLRPTQGSRLIIASLGITALVEALVTLLWCRKTRKPTRSILLTGLAGNILTQAGLWALLLLIPVRTYWAILLTAEVGIWALEGLLLAVIPANRLTLRAALSLSLWMNLISFGVGLALPV